MPRGSSSEDAEMVLIREMSNFEMLVANKPELEGCSPISVLQAFKECISNNLTFAPSAGLVYLYPSMIKTGVDPKTNQAIKTKVLVFDPSAEGRLSIAFQAGTILDLKRPVYEYNDKNQITKISCEFLVPSSPAPRWDLVSMDAAEFTRLMQKSAAKFGTANAGYTSHNGGIDPEFAFAKLIRHKLKKRGTNMNAQRNPVPANIPHVIDPAKGMSESIESTVNEGHEYVAYQEIATNVDQQGAGSETLNIDNL